MPFEITYINQLPEKPGVYIIYDMDSTPVYVGRSRSNVRARLLNHRRRRGNKVIRKALWWHTPFLFEWECMISVEQAEAILIRKLGTRTYCNLRYENDPADSD